MCIRDRDTNESVAGFDKDSGGAALKEAGKRLNALQDTMYAEGRRSLLIVLQGMDTGGKDGIIEHVVGAINPQGCEVHAFKAPNAEELEHDFLWRAVKRLPARGHVTVFNRSYYEEVIVVRVHPEFLDKQKLKADKDIWKNRFAAINAFEKHLAQSGTTVLKFFLNLSRDEQKQRFLDRLDDPDKRWKFSLGDVAERALWPKYMDAYEDMLRATSTKDAPWHILPADKKWSARLIAASVMIAALEGMGLKYPEVPPAARAELDKARAALIAEKGDK